MFTIRPARKRDQAAIGALIRTVGINPLGIKWQRFLVAVDRADAVVGCGQIKVRRDGSLELASVAVAEAWRKQGIGTAIVRELQAAYRGTLWLTCRADLTSYYEAFGFEEIADVDGMPAYFRRVKRIAALYQRLARREMGLAVMAHHWPSREA